MAKKDKKDKKKEKEEKKAKGKQGESEDEEAEESLGSKILLFFVTLLIIGIWLGIIAILIKSDVGGFGSTVLAPILKDVPGVNAILPEDDTVLTSEQLAYPYNTLDEAIARIKELEIELDSVTSNDTTDAQKIAELQEEVNNLMVYKEEQAEFEKEKEKYYEEVVFSDKAPDITEYKAYYESIDPENAEVLYKQVVEQVAEDEEIKNYAKTYSSMKPKEAAAIFDTMTDDLPLVAKILQAMNVESRSSILGKMDKENAARLTEIMKP